MRHGPAAPAPGASVGRRACLCPVSEHAADRSAPPMRLTCATTQRKAEQRAVSRVSVTLVRMPDLYGARFGTVPRVVVFAAAFGVRLRALLARFRRVVVAVPPPAWKWGVAVGVRWAVAMADGRRVRGSVGRHRPRAGIARALTSAHRSAMSEGDMTRRRGGVSPRETVQLRDTRHSARTRAAPPLPLSLTVPSHTLYRHSTALKAWNPRKQH